MMRVVSRWNTSRRNNTTLLRLNWQVHRHIKVDTGHTRGVRIVSAERAVEVHETSHYVSITHTHYPAVVHRERRRKRRRRRRRVRGNAATDAAVQLNVHIRSDQSVSLVHATCRCHTGDSRQISHLVAPRLAVSFCFVD